MPDTLQVAIERNQTDSLKDTSTLRTESGVSREAEREIQRALRGLRFGSIEIVVHDSQVVQIERREKTRLIRAGGIGGSNGNGQAH